MSTVDQPGTSTITVRVRFTAMLARALSLRFNDLVAFELPAGARYRDLSAAIAARFGDQLPPNTWDETTGLLHPHIQGLLDGLALSDPDVQLPDDAEITLLVGIAGG